MSDSKTARRQSRIVALKALFYFFERGASAPSIRDCWQYIVEEVEGEGEDDFSLLLLNTTLDNLGKIKVIIRAFAPQFPYEKIALINRVILVLGVAEMKFLGTPPVVVINEYIELAKSFGEEKSASLINGVLDHYRKSLGLSGERLENDGVQPLKSA